MSDSPLSASPAEDAGPTPTMERCLICGESVNLVWHRPGPLFDHKAVWAGPSDGVVLRFDAERSAALYAALKPVARAIHDQAENARQSVLRAVCACGHGAIGPDLPLCSLLDDLRQRGIS